VARLVRDTCRHRASDVIRSDSAFGVTVPGCTDRVKSTHMGAATATLQQLRGGARSPCCSATWWFVISLLGSTIGGIRSEEALRRECILEYIVL
jgi:hypothetical protein